MFSRRSLGLLFTALGLAAWCMMAGCTSTPLGPATDEVFLRHAWEAYKQTFIRPEGYVYDPARDGGEVTSEGQAYALLRAAWLGDADTFERVLRWSEAHLRRPDGLYAWRWTPGPGGGRLLDSGNATDGDEDAAFALILASQRFNRPEYLVRARELLTAIHAHTGISLPDGWLPSAGAWAVEERVVNLSYFTPYAYPYFQAVHPEGDWLAARRAGYALLNRTMADQRFCLPPDFIRVDAQGNPHPFVTGERFSSDFSFDAMRVYYRVALDCILNQDPMACADPAKIKELVSALGRDGRLVARYQQSGNAASMVESPSFYGGTLPALGLYAPQVAAQVLEKKLSSRNISHYLRDNRRYYDLNWVWFGLAAHGGLIGRNTPPPQSFATAP